MSALFEAPYKVSFEANKGACVWEYMYVGLFGYIVLVDAVDQFKFSHLNKGRFSHIFFKFRNSGATSGAFNKTSILTNLNIKYNNTRGARKHYKCANSFVKRRQFRTKGLEMTSCIHKTPLCYLIRGN